jgi:YHS domain-containing protein
MIKWWQFLFLVVFFVSSGFSINSAYSRSILIPDANNKYDLVSGKTINIKKYNTVYNGKRYWFNSYKNLTTFKKEPSKYVKGTIEKRKNTPNKKTEKNQKKEESQKKDSFWGW